MEPLDPQPLDPQSLDPQLLRNDRYVRFQTRTVFALSYADALVAPAQVRRYHPYTMLRSRSSQWSGVAEHDERSDGTGASEHYEEQSLGASRQKRGAKLQRLDSEIRFFKLNEIDANYKDNNTRIPDLSADIRIVFPTEEYIGKYVSHGQSKTVFVIRSSGRKEGRFDGTVLKISRGYDIEPTVARAPQPRGYQIVPKLYYEGIGKDGEVEYYCWVSERCIPLHRLAALSKCNKNACVLAACRCIARAALCRIHVSDCHYFNFGVRITSGATEHEVLIIDAGSRGLTESVDTKREVNQTMRKLWKWTELEIQASPTCSQKLWRQNEHTLEDTTQRLDSAWQSWPYLTTDPQVPTTLIDQEITAKCCRALRDFTRSPQGKVVELIGRSSVEWRGGAWNDRLSELYMRAVEEANTTFDADEDRVLTELYERITRPRTHNEPRTRTKEEIEAVVAFWWKLQTYRRRYLERKGRVDTAEEVLSEADIMKVKRDWEDYEMWCDLSDKQRKVGHLPSIYNAALHNRSGWAAVANAIIKYQLPQLPHMRKSDGVTEHIQSINRFCCDLLEWLKKFTSAALAYWRSPEYEKAHATSAHAN